MFYQSLKLTNFTVFRDASFEFAPGVNVLVGANGTGKTHVLKVLYAMQEVARNRKPLTRQTVENWNEEVSRGDFINLIEVFQIDSHAELISSMSGSNTQFWIEALVNNGKWTAQSNEFGAVTQLGAGPINGDVPRAVFIPSIDMLAHTKGFLSTYDEFKIDFDRTHRDIVSLLLSPERRNIDDLGIKLVDLSEGQASDVEEENERFFVVTRTGRFAAPIVSEGIRKLTSLVQLIRNGWIRPGATLFWDEPEASVSPSLLERLVHAILLLTRAGVQVFLTTHSYEILKELDLQATQGEVKYFALESNGGESIIHPTYTYDELKPNKIAEAFDSLLDRELTRSTGRSRKGANGN